MGECWQADGQRKEEGAEGKQMVNGGGMSKQMDCGMSAGGRYTERVEVH